jgi:superfamily II DNA/RNA helicase
LLFHFLNEETINQAIIFTATRADTERLSALLIEKGLSAVALHGDLTQSNRNKIMDSFSRGKDKILVTTDIASRGLDLIHVSHVFNFDIPKHTEEYIHRIGRTGRAGELGDAISIVGPKDWDNFKKVESFVAQAITFSKVAGIMPKFKGLKPVQKKVASVKKVVEEKKKTVVRKARVSTKKQENVFHESVDVGATPMRRKKRTIVIDNDED